MTQADERNFSARVAYEGTSYAGFQLQADEPTVQGEIEKALRQVFDDETRVHGASRTDAGVHALGQVVSFKARTVMPSSEIERAANALLPRDISIGPVLERDIDFHARFSNRGKRYVYRIFVADRDSPFLGRYTIRIPRKPDVALMREAASLLKGEKDFRSFSPKLMEGENPVKRMDSITIRESDPLLEIEVVGSGFMYQMVRRLSAALLALGQGELELESIEGWLAEPETGACILMLPPEGLFLAEVLY